MSQTNAPSDLFIPDNLSSPMPLLVAFHGGGRDGESQLNLWKPLAVRERFIVSAPTSGDSYWNAPEDAMRVQTSTREITASPRVDKNRVYFFGHSLGGVPALLLGFANRNVIAAVALHSPCWGRGIYDLNEQPPGRPLHLGIWVGAPDCDSNHDLAKNIEGRYNADRNFSLKLEVLPQHQHNDIYTRPDFTGDIWSFLKLHHCQRANVIS